MDRRVHVSKGKLVRRNLAIGVHVPLAQEKNKLLFGKIGVESGKGDHMKSQIPGRKPGVLPLVGHRDDIAVKEMGPLVVPALLPGWGRRWLVGIAFEPIFDDIMIELLGP